MGLLSLVSPPAPTQAPRAMGRDALTAHNRAMGIAALTLADTVRELNERGLQVVAITAQAIGLPTVRVSPCRLLDGMVQKDEAVFYSFGQDDHGKWREGQFQLSGVRVVWREAYQ